MPAPRVAFAFVDFPPNTLTNISVINTPPTGSHALKTWKNAGGFVQKKRCFAPQVFLVCSSTSVVQLAKSNSLVRALAGAALSYCDLPPPVGAQRVRGFHFERIRARDANGSVPCFLNQLLRLGIRFASSGLRWLFTCK
jgi:hypothetical protein